MADELRLNHSTLGQDRVFSFWKGFIADSTSMQHDDISIVTSKTSWRTITQCRSFNSIDLSPWYNRLCPKLCTVRETMASEPVSPAERKKILRVIFISLLLDLVRCLIKPV